MEEVIVHSYDWQTATDPDTGYSTIHCWGLNRESVPHLLRFHDFDAFCYVELPLFVNNSYVNWEGFREKLVYERICEMLGDDKPHRYRFEKKEKLYFYKGKGKTYPMLLLCFKNISSMIMCRNKLKRGFKVYGLKGGNKNGDETTICVRVWESDISIIRKMLTLRNCKFAQWFKVKAVKIQGDDKISRLDQEYVADWKTLIPIPQEETISWLTQPTIFSYDIETYSDRHTAMPDPLCAKHVVYLISVVFQRARDPSSRKTDIILFGDCSETKMANVIKVGTEMELIDKLQELILKYDPDICIGYNQTGYDNAFLETRLQRRMREWKPIGRLLNKPAVIKTLSWSSSAFKNQDFSILEMEGRISVDLLPVVRRDHKLPVYRLDFVAKHFLGKGKHDVTAKQMFETYELQECLSEKYDAETSKVPESFIKLYPETFKEEWKIKYKEYALDEMRKVVDYCVVDSDLVLDLFEKINVWIGLLQMSNIMGITLSEIFTRGTGVRMRSKMYDEASKNNIVLDEVDFPHTSYEGGFVYPPTPGIYHNIPIYDFAGLYPSIMLAYNIDHRTCVPPEMMDKVPDEDCNVIEWDDEVDDDEESEDELEVGELSKEGIDKKKEKKSPSGKKKIVHHKYKFVKEPKGLMPKILSELIKERANVRKKQKDVPKDSLEWIILEQNQLAIKQQNNSFYGICGSSFSNMKHPYCSSSITAKARESTKKMNAYLTSRGYTIVYGDTDSTMPDIGITDTKTAWETAEKIAGELTAMYPDDMKVELEAVMSTMLCIKKKMYLCIPMDKNGDPIEDPDKMKIRGVTLARRDNCKYQREFYKSVVWKVMHGETFMNVFNFIIDECLKLLTRQVPWENLTMIKGLGANYKSPSYMMAVFANEMQKSGNPLVPGDRITYLIVRNGDIDEIKDETKTGEKMKLPEMFLERAESDNPYHIDYIYYLERVMVNCIQSQLWNVGYGKILDDLEKKYRDNDQNKFLFELGMKLIEKDSDELKKVKVSGYNNLLLKLFQQFDNDKDKVVEYLLADDSFKKIAKPLHTYYVKRRKGRQRRLSTRIDREPIMMIVRLAYAKAEVCKSIRNYKPKPKKQKISLKILKSIS